MRTAARNLAFHVILGLAVALVGTHAGASDRIDPARAIERSQSAIGRLVGDHSLIATTGEVFSLASYRGKPLVVSLVYSSCSSLCPITTQHLIAAVERAGGIVGPERFNVLTVGFDARNDTPARMTQFAKNQHIALANWRVASGEAAQISALLADLGFSYAEIAGGFDHVTQTTILDADGRVFRQVYGEDFPISMLIEPLKDLTYGIENSFSIRNVLDRIKLICTTYDPGAGRYRIDYGLIFGASLAALLLVLMFGLIVREWLHTSRIGEG